MVRKVFVLLLLCVVLQRTLGATSAYPSPITQSTRISNQGYPQTTTIAAYILLCTSVFVTLNNTENCIGVLDDRGNFVNSSCPAGVRGSNDMFCLSTGCYALNPTLKAIVPFYINGSSVGLINSTLFTDPQKLFGYHTNDNIYFITIDKPIQSAVIYTAFVFQNQKNNNPPTSSTVLPNLNNTTPVVGLVMPTDSSFFVAFLNGTTVYEYTTRGTLTMTHGTFGSIQLMGRDYVGRLFIVDATCNCIQIIDINTGMWMRTILPGATTNPRTIQTSRNDIFILDDNGITRFDEPIQWNSTIATNSTCPGKNGTVYVSIMGGGAPYTFKVYPDGNSILPGAPYTNTQNWTFSVGNRNPNIAPYYVYTDSLSTEFQDIWTGTTGATKPQAADVPAYAGSYSYGVSMVRLTQYGFRGTNYTSGGAVINGLWQGRYFQRVEMMINVGNGGQNFSISLGPFVTNFVAGNFTPNTWNKFTIDLSTAPGSWYQWLYFQDTSNATCTNCNWVYIDNIVLIPYADPMSRFIQITDYCGVNAYSPPFTVMVDQGLTTTVTSVPPSCSAGGVETDKAHDASMSASVTGGVAPYTYTWSMASGNPNTTVNNLAAINNTFYIYDNAIQFPFSDAGSDMNGRNSQDSSLYLSPPYSFSASPTGNVQAWTFNAKTPMLASQYYGIEFYMNGGPVGQQLINVQLNRIGVSVGPQYLLHNLAGLPSIPPNIWIRVFYPIASLGSTVTDFTGISFTAKNTWNQPTIYFDDMKLIGNSAYLTVKDSNTCSLTTYLNISSPALVQVTPSATNAKCYGAADGTVTMNVIGGTPPYNYTWLNVTGGNSTSSTFVGAPQEFVNAIAMDSHGCVAATPVTSIEVLQPPPLGITGTVTDALCYGGQGSVSAILSGGVTPFTYTWTSSSHAVTNTYHEVPQALPVVIFEESMQDWFTFNPNITSVVQILCPGAHAADAPNFVSYSGYCAISVQANNPNPKNITQVLSIGCQGCIDLTRYTAMEMMIRLINPSDAYNLSAALYKEGLLASAVVPLFNSSYVANSDWVRIHVPFSKYLTSLVDYFTITTGFNTTGQIFIDNIVMIPNTEAASLVTGTDVNSGYHSVLQGSAGDYVLTATDDNNCPTTRVFTINHPPGLNVSYTTVSTNSNESQPNGQITLIVNGGVPPYVYSWGADADGVIIADSTSSVAMNLPAGTYEVGVADANGCPKNLTIVLSTQFIPNYVKISTGISSALGAIVGLALLVASFALMMLIIRWEAFRSHGPFFCAVIVVGVYFAYGSVVALLPVPSTASCTLFPWLLGIGFTLVYGCLFIKTWTLHKIYKSAEKLKRVNLTPLYIIKGIGLYLSIELVILIVWTAVDKPTTHYQKMVDGNYQLQCTAHPTFWAIFAGTKAAWLLFGVALSILTRNVSTEYSESKSIAYATYNIVALLVIGVPLAIALQNIPGGLMIVEGGVIIIAFTFTMCSLFFGIWMRILFPSSDSMITMVGKGSNSSTGFSSTTHSPSAAQKSSGHSAGSSVVAL